MRIACIGTRDLTPEQEVIIEELGKHIAQGGHIVRTGNAPKSDQCFARGANEVNPAQVELELPWPRFEQGAIVPGNTVKSLEDHSLEAQKAYRTIAEKYHPAWPRLSQGAQKLMTRNSAIMFREVDSAVWDLQLVPVDLCLAWPSNRRGGGGTGQGMRIAKHEGIKLVDLSQLSTGAIEALALSLQAG